MNSSKVPFPMDMTLIEPFSISKLNLLPVLRLSCFLIFAGTVTCPLLVMAARDFS